MDFIAKSLMGEHSSSMVDATGTAVDKPILILVIISSSS
jgi:hypothetical protein